MLTYSETPVERLLPENSLLVVGPWINPEISIAKKLDSYRSLHRIDFKRSWAIYEDCFIANFRSFSTLRNLSRDYIWLFRLEKKHILNRVLDDIVYVEDNGHFRKKLKEEKTLLYRKRQDSKLELLSDKDLRRFDEKRFDNMAEVSRVLQFKFDDEFWV